MKKTVYDENGASYTVDSVDAREYLATGRFFPEIPKSMIVSGLSKDPDFAKESKPTRKRSKKIVPEVESNASEDSEK